MNWLFLFVRSAEGVSGQWTAPQEKLHWSDRNPRLQWSNPQSTKLHWTARRNVAQAPEYGRKRTTEILNGSLNFSGKMASGETINGVPTVACATSGAPTITAVAANSATMLVSNVLVAIGQGLQFVVTGGTAGDYVLLATATTNLGQTINLEMNITVY